MGVVVLAGAFATEETAASMLLPLPWLCRVKRRLRQKTLQFFSTFFSFFLSYVRCKITWKRRLGYALLVCSFTGFSFFGVFRCFLFSFVADVFFRCFFFYFLYNGKIRSCGGRDCVRYQWVVIISIWWIFFLNFLFNGSFFENVQSKS